MPLSPHFPHPLISSDSSKSHTHCFSQTLGFCWFLDVLSVPGLTADLLLPIPSVPAGPSPSFSVLKKCGLGTWNIFSSSAPETLKSSKAGFYPPHPRLPLWTGRSAFQRLHVLIYAMAQMVIPASQDGSEECESESVVGSWHSVRQRLRKLLSNSPIIPSFRK